MTSFLNLLEPLREQPGRRHAHDSEDTDLRDTAARADSLARQTLADANGVLAQAELDAKRLRSEAAVQAEALRETAWSEGFREGDAAARAQVEAELQVRWTAERDMLRAQVETLLSDIVDSRQALWDDQEAEMIGFVLDIARQVVKTEVTQNPDVVGAVVRNALRRVTDKENVRIRVSVGDAGKVREMRDDLMSLVDGIRNLEIIDDRRVGDGGCLIETNAGTIDAKIETQLSEVERSLANAAG